MNKTLSFRLYSDSNRRLEQNLIDSVNKFLQLEIQKVQLEQLTQESQSSVLLASPTGSLPVLKHDSFVISGLRSIINYLMNFAAHKASLLLRSDSLQLRAEVEMWVDFSISSIWPVLIEIESQLSSNAPVMEVFNEAMNDLVAVIHRLNNHLRFRTYMVSTSYSLADLVVSGFLFNLFNTVIDNDLQFKFNHVTRWFKYVAQVREFSSVFGEPQMRQVSLVSFQVDTSRFQSSQIDLEKGDAADDLKEDPKKEMSKREEKKKAKAEAIKQKKKEDKAKKGDTAHEEQAKK